MSQPIRMRFLVVPVSDNEEDAVHIDIQFTEDDLQELDTKHGLEDFIEKFIEPGLAYLLDHFQQYYSSHDDLLSKTIDVGRATLPRSIAHYREKIALLKAKAAKRAA